MNRISKTFTFFLTAMMFTPLPSLWAGTRKVHLQGKLTDNVGTPLSGVQTVTFKLYDAATAGTMVWTSGVLSVTPASGGLFNVPLQDGTPSLDSVSFDKPYFLGITMGADPEMTPRQEFGASAQAQGSSGDFNVGKNLGVGGRVGAGIVNPQAALHVATSLLEALRVERSGTTPAQYRFQIQPILNGDSSDLQLIADTNATGFAFHTRNASGIAVQGIEINRDGNVGFGTNNPQTKLHAVTPALEVLRLERIGTTPAQYRFHIQPVMNGDNSDLQLSADTSATGYGFYVRNAQGVGIHGMGIDRSGNVGMGTESPQYRLDVAGSIHCTGTFVSSDRRLKKNIQGLSPDVVGRIGRLTGVSYEWDRAQMREMGFGRSRVVDQAKTGIGAGVSVVGKGEEEDDFTGRQIGLIAQEVGEEFPDLVHTDSQGIKSVNYSALTAVLVEGMKAQQKQIAALRNELDQLKKKVK